MTQNLQPPSATLIARAKEILRQRGISVYRSTLEPHLYIVVNTRQRGLADHVTAAALVEQAGLDAERP